MKLLLALVGAVLAVPASALAGGPTMVVRDVPLDAQRTLASAPPPFNMVAVHWRGKGAVSFRTRSEAGRWSSWQRFDDDGLVQQGWHIGGLEWTGSATAIRFRRVGTVSRVRAYYVDSPSDPAATRRLQIANSPLIISRFGWQADESIRRAAPQYSDAIHVAVVHHTAGSNNYTRDQSAAIVRGIELYHVKGNGWNDIGYNFLVDKYGQIFEGRYGGVDKAVVGAHALGFNTGSVGVAMIGTYSTAKPTAAATNALEQLLAWKLDLAHVDPLSTLTYLSGGNPRFPSGVPVFLRAVSGHRDTGFTDCPGNALYALLPQIAKAAAAIGGPKIYAPLAAQRGEGQVRFTARLSATEAWTVTIVNSAGTQVAQGTGTGTSVDWTWDGSTAPPDKYTWTIAAGDARPAVGSLGATTALALQKVVAQPAAIAPTEATTVSYTLTTPATVTATLVGPTGATIATLLTAQKSAGLQTLAFTPPQGLAAGKYTILVAAISGTKSVTAIVPVTVDDILGGLSASALGATFSLTRAPAAVSLQVLKGSTVVASPAAAAAPGSQTLTWPTLPDGAYTVALTITDEIGTYTRSLPLVVDTIPPRVTALSYRALRFRLSEPATVVLTVGAHAYRRVLPKATTTQFWLKTKPQSYVLTATDAAGNVTTVRYPG
jgi:N-acetylmuramoyl-L-alanine amidase-like protein